MKTIIAALAAAMLLAIMPIAPPAHAASPDPYPFELPITGATGWMASTQARYQTLYGAPKGSGDAIGKLRTGEGFVILEEQGDWWKVRTGDGTAGWVRHIGCFINLPDILPSIVYMNTNAVSSVFKSSGYDIPNITGQKLYDARSFNCRLGRKEYVMPALYASSMKLAQAQRDALADGNTIVLYEAFRPHSAQMSVGQNLRSLINANQEVGNAINSNGWSAGWFIAQSRSSHQRGAAFDVSLSRITAQKTTLVGGYEYTRITGYSLYEMPSDIHELSPSAALHATPNGKPKALTEGAYLLQGYFTDNGFKNISSEWWHFTDAEGQRSADNVGILGEFETGSDISSILPDGSGNGCCSWKHGKCKWGWKYPCEHNEKRIIPLPFFPNEQRLFVAPLDYLPQQTANQ